MNDFTSKIERNVEKENKNKVKYLFRLWNFIFLSTKRISSIYLGLFLLLSILRPCLGLLWGKYIFWAENVKNTKSIYWGVIAIICIYCFLNWCAELIESFMAVNGDGDMEQLDAVQANRQQELMHCKMFKKISDISPEYMEISKFIDRVNNVFDFAGNRENGLNRKVMLNGYILVAKIVSVFSIAVTLYVLHPWLTMILLAAPLPTIWNSMLKEKIRFQYSKDNMELIRKAEYFQKLMLSTANKEIKTLGLFDFFYKKWKNCADECTYNERQVIKHQTVLGIINSFIINVLNIIGIVIAIIFMIYGKISLAELGIILSLISVLINDTGNLFEAFSAFISKKNEAAQFFTFMDMPQQTAVGCRLQDFQKVEAQHVKYRYPLSENYVLDDIDFTLSQGEKVAFVGENGAGKSTFIKMITGTLNPSEGVLKINGCPFFDVQQDSRYDIQSVVVQNPSHYITFTIDENVYLGDTTQNRQEQRINEAIDFAGLAGIEKNTLLGRDVGGIDLSGGQWQKLAIARAVYRNRDLIILDEPTSNLDPKAESEIFSKYLEMAKDKTVIFVTHRVAAASLADRIVVFDKGKIVEDGTHSKLIEEKGKYAELYQNQARWYNR